MLLAIKQVTAWVSAEQMLTESRNSKNLPRFSRLLLLIYKRNSLIANKNMLNFHSIKRDRFY